MNNVLEVDSLSVAFASAPPGALAIDSLSFKIGAGETVALVGESGCGKSLTALAVMGLLPCTQVRRVAGRVLLDGEDLTEAAPERLRELRGGRLGMIFQEPLTALNPVMRVGDQIAEVLCAHEGLKPRAAWDASVELLRQVGIPSPERRAEDYPHRMSGGMRQRVMIAMAIACKPDLLIADEPTTALDVTIQLQVLDLLRSLRSERGMSLLIITHDLGVVAALADRVVVMYAGRKVEEGSAEDILLAPRHPYTQGLLACLPGSRGDAPGATGSFARLNEIPGTVPAILGCTSGCEFANRCTHARMRCRQDSPATIEVGRGHAVACHLFDTASA